MGVELDILFLAFEVNFELRFSLGSPSKRFFGIIKRQDLHALVA
jgi:hypothetical protein